MLHRPYIRKSTREEVENRAEKNEQGKFLDANTGKPIENNYHLGHKYGHEFRYEKAQAEKEGLTQKEFNDRMNNPDLYQIEDPKSNMSHQYESKENPYESVNNGSSAQNAGQGNSNAVNGFSVTSVSNGETNVDGETTAGQTQGNSEGESGQSQGNSEAAGGESQTGGESMIGGEEGGEEGGQSM